MPLFIDKWPPLPPAPGLEDAAGLEPPELCRVEITVGNMNEGESLPANPNLVRPVPLINHVSV